MSSLISSTSAPLFNACADIGNEAVDARGFISVRRLLERFHTKLRLRPLLVEGMIGSTTSSNGRPTWTILIDSERYRGIEDAIQSESAANPLTPRFRFTVAHELAHSLAFRTSEFGITPPNRSATAANKSAVVRAIETETDQLAPLLLCAESTLASRLKNLSGPIDLELLGPLRRECGMSREVLLNRLALSRALDRTGLWQRAQLQDFGLAIGERQSGETESLRRDPVFLNFSRAVPRGLLIARQRDRVPLEVAFGVNAWGAAREKTTVGRAGTASSPDAEEMTVEIEIERDSPHSESEFLILVRDKNIRRAIQDLEIARRKHPSRRVSF
jgi:hypothetical protein